MSGFVTQVGAFFPAGVPNPFNGIDLIKGPMMGTIKTETVTLAFLAKGFRNLIHPGRSIRLGEKCNRGTAYTALAALEHVVNDLSP